MIAPIISISSNSSEESVGSHDSRVILFGTIPAIISVIHEVPIAPVDPIVAPEVGAVSVISPTRVLDLVDYSSCSDSDPSEDSLLVAPELPLVSPFLCTDESKVDNESEPAEQKPETHESLTPSFKFPLAPVVAPPRIHRWLVILVRPMRLFPSVNLIAPTPMGRRSAPLSTIYPPTTSETSPDSSSERSLDSSSPSAGPSRERCRSPATLVPSYTPVLRLIAHALADLSPRKRFRDSYSSEVSGDEHMEMGTADAETVADLGISEGVGAHTEDGIDLGVEVATSDVDPLATERVVLADRVRSLGRENLRVRTLLCIERDRVDSLHCHMELSQEEFCQVRRDCDDTRRRLRRLKSLVERRLGFHHRTMTITGSGMTPEAIEELVSRRVEEALVAYEATRATNALEDESKNQNGSDGDNGNGGNLNPNENDRGARPRTIGADAAFSMSWRELMKLMAEVYCPRTKIQKMESELWNLTVKKNDLAAYTQKIPRAYHENVIAAEPTRLQDAVRIANNLIDQKLKGYAVKNAENKRKFDNSQKENLNKRVVTCYECGRQCHYRNDCIKLKDQNCGNKTRNKNGIGEAKGKAYVLGGGDANPDSNVVTGTFLLNNHYASVLFDLGADRSFVSTTFSTLLDIIHNTLDVSYAVELADGRISETNTVLRSYMLGLLGHPFNIYLMSVELGSFYVVIVMDWLANHHAVIVCDEKIVRIPYRNEVLIVQGDGSSKGKKSKLSIISCMKTQKYIKKGCLILQAQVMRKETEDKSEEKRLEDVPTVWDFPDVFPQDFLGLPPT
uniref:CCHC-type domain-containing protein n=1 Tax=Tanacetum cinerariifolium TaxID=118510 RepID=A0A699GNP1_TANCI|nr:hypothetical protein [Tanacetum cinerariifolium]